MATITTKGTPEQLTIVFRYKRAWKARMAIGASCEIAIIDKRDG